MSDQSKRPVGGEEPRKPKHSLPSYGEPTPETHRKLTREEEAEIALNRTAFAAGTSSLLVVAFLLTMAAVPAIQFAADRRATHSWRRLPTLVTFAKLTSRFNLHALRTLGDLWEMLPRPDETKTVEKTLQNDSLVAQWLLPKVQLAVVGLLHGGTEQAYLGRGDWLFYRSDVDYVVGENFLDPARLKRRTHLAAVQPNAVEAIVRFRNQLARRGIDLMIVPVPVKPTVDGEMLSANVSGTQSLENGSFSQLKEELRKQAVRLFDPEPLLIEKKSASATGPLYLKSDTHWGAEAMEFVAQQLAANLHLPASSRGGTIRVEQKTITAPGDIARMLKLPAAETSRYRQEITVHQVMVGNGTWRASKDADVLLLGDSFSNIFSQSALGWGESAGFAEQLSRALGGRPLDCILRNSDGAFATREILARELARGRDRLATKKLVIWQFATRELAFGNWKLIDMRLRAPPPSHFFTPKSGEQTVVTGTIESLSPVPQPGSVPYADHIMAVHLVDVSTPQNGGADLESLVYLLSMRDNVWTTAARLRVGDQITVRLRPWADVAAAYEQINRSEVEDAAVQLEEPSWGELID